MNQFTKMNPKKSIADHISKIVSLTQRFKNMNMEQKDPIIIVKI